MFDNNSEKISQRDIEYYRQRFLNRMYSVVISTFALEVKRTGITKKKLAIRLDREPAQITRWLSGPSNWTLETYSDLLLSMGFELDPVASPVRETTALREVGTVRFSDWQKYSDPGLSPDTPGHGRPTTYTNDPLTASVEHPRAE